MDIPMLFAVTLNSVRLGRRPSHPRHRCGTSYCRRSCALGSLLKCMYVVCPDGYLLGWIGQAVMARQPSSSRQANTNTHLSQPPSHHPLERSITRLQ